MYTGNKNSEMGGGNTLENNADTIQENSTLESNIPQVQEEPTLESNETQTQEEKNTVDLDYIQEQVENDYLSNSGNQSYSNLPKPRDVDFESVPITAEELSKEEAEAITQARTFILGKLANEIDLEKIGDSEDTLNSLTANVYMHNCSSVSLGLSKEDKRPKLLVEQKDGVLAEFASDKDARAALDVINEDFRKHVVNKIPYFGEDVIGGDEEIIAALNSNGRTKEEQAALIEKSQKFIDAINNTYKDEDGNIFVDFAERFGVIEPIKSTEPTEPINPYESNKVSKPVEIMETIPDEPLNEYGLRALAKRRQGRIFGDKFSKDETVAIEAFKSTEKRREQRLSSLAEEGRVLSEDNKDYLDFIGADNDSGQNYKRKIAESEANKSAVKAEIKAKRQEANSQKLEELMTESKWGKLLDKYNKMPTKYKIAVGALGGLAVGGVAAMAGAYTGAAAFGVLGYRAGKSYLNGRAKNRDKLYNADIDKIEEYNKLADNNKRKALGMAAVSLVLGGVIGNALSGGFDAHESVPTGSGSGTSYLEHVQPQTGAEDHAENLFDFNTDGSGDVLESTPEVVEFSPEVYNINSGEGLLQTFSEMGIDAAKGHQLLQDTELMHKLVEKGIAYPDASLGGYGLNMTPDGKLPHDVVELIAQKAK